ncbi:hypothetical protein CRUP_013969, partial [Coryphaenoides rupestris]
MRAGRGPGYRPGTGIYGFKRRPDSIVLVTVLDVNDFRPRFAQRIFNTSVFENEPSGSSVITLSATDLDEGENGRLLYSMRGAGADVFSLNVDTGLVRLLRLLQSSGHYNLTVSATDQGIPPLSGTAILLERPPGLEVGRVIATDVDDGVNGEVRYAFLQTGAGNRDWENFYIDALSGVITTAVRLDREKQATQSLILVAYDQGQPVPYETTQPLQVTLLDIDDNEPVFLKPP